MSLLTRRKRSCLACILVLFCCGLASAQNFDKVSKQLQQSVKKGEITQRQADMMMGILKREASKDKRGARVEPEKKKQETAKLARSTKPAAKSKTAEVRKPQHADKKGEEAKDAYLVKLRKQLHDSVEADKISKEEAVKKLADARKKMEHQPKDGLQRSGGERPDLNREHYSRMEAQVKKAVEEGKVSPEAARKRLQGLRQRMAEQNKQQPAKQPARSQGKDDQKMNFARMEAQVKKAVDKGKISPEAARKRLQSVRQRMAEQNKQQPGKQPARSQGKNGQKNETLARRLKAAVKAGQLTEAQAKAKWEALAKKKN